MAFGLLSAFANVREKARGTVCASNLKQIGMAALIYVEDSDGRFMPVAHDNSQSPTFWFKILQPYLKSEQVLKCPSDATTPVRSGYGTSSYGYNAHLGGVAFSELLPPGLDKKNKIMAQVQRPAATVMMTDSGSIALAGSAPETWPAMVPCPPSIGDAAIQNPTPPPIPPVIGYVSVGALPAPRARHQGKTNVLWVDGHVSSASIGSFYTAPGSIAPGETIPGYSPCLRPEKGCP
ncbi:MAG: hypothetical protein JO316_10385 [Abitibacteriaceae bacterium]|nr:hypothetical protein [Abditibacteriaceae bacterium]